MDFEVLKMDVMQCISDQSDKNASAVGEVESGEPDRNDENVLAVGEVEATPPTSVLANI